MCNLYVYVYVYVWCVCTCDVGPYEPYEHEPGELHEPRRAGTRIRGMAWRHLVRAALTHALLIWQLPNLAAS